MSHYTDADVQAAWTALRDAMGDDPVEYLHPAKVIRTVLDAVARDIALRAASRALRTAAADPHARLSGHGGVSVRWLRAMADEIERGAL